MVLIIDHDDSFTYNLVQMFGSLGQRVLVKGHRETTIADIESLAPDYLVISSGSQSVAKTGISLEAIQYFAGEIPILGVSLGHQLIVEAFGGHVELAEQPTYGKMTTIDHDGETIFSGIEQSFQVARYDSFIVQPQSLPTDFVVSATTKTNEVMAIRHQTAALEGIQFHPESFMTTNGIRLLDNFLITYGGKNRCTSI